MPRGRGDNWLSPELRNVLKEIARRALEEAGAEVRVGGRRWPPPSKPLPADGIKARSVRGRIGETWWSRTFVDALEAIGVGGRLARGKRYARGGQVLTLEVDPGRVRSKVQGSRKRPYRVAIVVATIGERDWERVTDALAERAAFAARLLSGEMPPEIVEVFADTRVPLFPTSPSELRMECTCPDYATPCKHAAATLYLLAERFDADPFEVFRLRGRDRETLLAGIRDRQVARDAGPPDVRAFWEAGAALDAVAVRPVSEEHPDAFVRSLGPAGVDCGGRDLADVLAGCYEAIARRAEELGGRADET